MGAPSEPQAFRGSRLDPRVRDRHRPKQRHTGKHIFERLRRARRDRRHHYYGRCYPRPGARSAPSAEALAIIGTGRPRQLTPPSSDAYFISEHPRGVHCEVPRDARRCVQLLRRRAHEDRLTTASTSSRPRARATPWVSPRAGVDGQSGRAAGQLRVGQRASPADRLSRQLLMPLRRGARFPLRTACHSTLWSGRVVVAPGLKAVARSVGDQRKSRSRIIESRVPRSTGIAVEVPGAPPGLRLATTPFRVTVGVEAVVISGHDAAQRVRSARHLPSGRPPRVPGARGPARRAHGC